MFSPWKTFFFFLIISLPPPPPPPKTLKQRKPRQGPVPDVFARALRGLAGAKLARAGQGGASSFRAADGESAALRASFKADDGYLYPLDRAFFYAPKPPTLLQFDDVAGVEFVRRGGGVLAASQKTFDLAVRVRDLGSGGTVEHVFRGIAKQEWAGLFEFLKAKGIRIDNLRDAAAGAGGGGRAFDLGGGSAKGGDGGDDDDEDSGDDEEFEAGSESESSDEESDSADDDDDESGGEGGKAASKSKSKKKKKKRSSTSPAGGTPSSGQKQKKQKRKQAPREAGAPKKPMAAYMHFSNAKRSEVLAANPGMAFGEVGKATGELWRALDAEGKRPWEEAAARDKERFAEEEAAWQAGKRAKAAEEEGGAGGGGGGEEEEAGKEGA